MSERITFYIVKDDSNNGMWRPDSDEPVTVDVIECTGKETDKMVVVDEPHREHFSYRTQLEKSRAQYRTAIDALNAYCADRAATVDSLTERMNRQVARSRKAALLLMSLNAGKTEVTK